MTWTGREESVACCDGLGPVQDNEAVCRILIKRTVEPLFYTWFARKDLFPDGVFSNVCGTQDGLSVDRSSNLSDDEVSSRSAARAALGNNRMSNGGLQAEVSAIRAIARWDDPSNAFRIYDDPLQNNLQHAVIRGCENIPDEDRASLMIELEELFTTPRGDFKGH